MVLWREALKPSVSIVMPVYRGARYIDKSIDIVSRFMNRMGRPYEILVVDDGSDDNTREVAEMMARELDCVKVLGYERNRGKGYAFIYGALRSKGDVVVLLDADLDIPPQQVAILLKAIDRGADIAITNKWHRLSKTRASLLRKFMSRAFNLLVRFLLGLSFRDTQTGAKAFRREALLRIIKNLYVKRYAFDVEVLYVAKKLGYMVVEVPSIASIRLKRPPTIGMVWRMMLELLSIF
ncbi:MAG: hypothetical protein DRM97_01805, partial [Thermoprotei archaeon]